MKFQGITITFEFTHKKINMLLKGGHIIKLNLNLH